MDGMSFAVADVVIIVAIVGFFIRQELALKSIAAVLKMLGEDHAKLMDAVTKGKDTTIEEHRGMVEAMNEMTKTLVAINTKIDVHLDDERSKP